MRLDLLESIREEKRRILEEKRSRETEQHLDLYVLGLINEFAGGKCYFERLDFSLDNTVETELRKRIRPVEFEAKLDRFYSALYEYHYGFVPRDMIDIKINNPIITLQGKKDGLFSTIRFEYLRWEGDSYPELFRNCMTQLMQKRGLQHGGNTLYAAGNPERIENFEDGLTDAERSVGLHRKFNLRR